MFNWGLKKRVLELEKKMWAMENPPKYKLLEEIEVGNLTYTIASNNVEWEVIYGNNGYFKRIVTVIMIWSGGSERVADISEEELSMIVSKHKRDLEESKSE